MNKQTIEIINKIGTWGIWIMVTGLVIIILEIFGFLKPLGWILAILGFIMMIVKILVREMTKPKIPRPQYVVPQQAIPPAAPVNTPKITQKQLLAQQKALEAQRQQLLAQQQQKQLEEQKRLQQQMDLIMKS